MRYLTNRDWWEAAGTRAIKTMAQTIIAVIGTGFVLSDINWIMVISATIVAGILSLATSLAGLPEVETSTSTTETSGYISTDDEEEDEDDGDGNE